MTNIIYIVRALNHLFCSVTGISLCLFIISYLRSKPLGQQTFYDKVLISYFIIHAICTSNSITLAFTDLYPLMDHQEFISMLLTLLQSINGNMVCIALIFSLTVKILQIYTTLISQVIFDENKFIKIFYGLTYFCIFVIQSLEFILRSGIPCHCFCTTEPISCKRRHNFG